MDGAGSFSERLTVHWLGTAAAAAESMGCGASAPAADSSPGKPEQGSSSSAAEDAAADAAASQAAAASGALARRSSLDGAGRSVQAGDRRSARRAAQRRGSAIASSIAAFQTTDVEKGAEQLSMIVDAIRARPVFEGLDDDVLRRAAQVMYEKEIDEGTTIIQQGETADHFYVLAEGKVQVLINGKSKRIMSPGSGFGELGVLYGLPRSATCVAQTAARVWVLDRKPFKHIVVREQTRKRAEKEKFLRTVPLFASLAERQPRKLARLADAMDRKEFEEGETLIKQDDAGDEFFIIARGSVDISDQSDNPDGAAEEQPVITRTVGDYFGELALLKNVPRTATVVAVGEAGVSVYVLKRARFERLININEVNFRK